MDKKYAHAYMTGLSKTADLSSFASGTGNFLSQIPGFVYHAVADPAVGMVRDNYRATSGLLGAYGKLLHGDFQGARNALPGVINAGGSALGNGALTALNLGGAILSAPFGEAPEGALIAAETGLKAGGLSAIKSLFSRLAASGSKAVGPTASNSIAGTGQAFWPWIGQGYAGISSSASGLSNAGNIIKGVSRATQPIADLAERLGVKGSSSWWSNAGTAGANRMSFALPQSYRSLPWYKGGPLGFGILEGAANGTSEALNSIREGVKPVANGIRDYIKKISPVEAAEMALPVAALGAGGIGLYNATHIPHKGKPVDQDVIN